MMDTDNNIPLPACPECGQEDRVGWVTELAEKENDLALRLAPPDAPSSPAPLVTMNEGLGCVGALFFGTAFFLSVSYGSMVASIIFGVFVLFFAIAFMLTILRGLRSRKKLLQEEDLWLHKMEAWSNLCYCARDDLVFDPQSAKSAKADDLEDLLKL